MKKLTALLLALAMVVVLAACGDSESDASAETSAETSAAAESNEETDAEEESEDSGTVEAKGTIKVGHLLDITGTEAATGAQAQAAFEYAVTAIEAETGYTIEVVEGDCQSDSSKAAQAATSMVEEGCIAIFGPTQIGHKSAVAGALEDNGVTLVLYNGTPTGMIASSSWAVALGGGTAAFPTVMADYAYNVLGYRTIYTIAQDTTGGHNYVDPFITCFEALGGTVVGSDYIAMGTNDWSSYLTKIINSGCDAIAGWTSSSDAIAFWKEWYASGAYESIPVVATMHGGFSDYYIMNALNSANSEITDAVLEMGVYAPINYSYSIDSDENAEFVEGWQEAHDGAVPGGNNLPGSIYQALLLLTNAIDEIGIDADAETLYNAMLGCDFYGPEGHTVFTDSSVATKDVYVVKVVTLDDGSFNYDVVETYAQVDPAGYNYDGENYIG